jgi:23S rRNA pseudouridine2605 synthase
MRLQVFLSRAGVCSRRKALGPILAGRVTVNGQKVTEPSFDVRPSSDKVCLDGRPVGLSQKIYILLHKPPATMSTVSDPHASKTVLRLIPEHLRSGLHPVGRLDKDTTGLLLLTNDGEWTHKMSHPSYGVEKVYRVVLNRDAGDSDIRQISRGVVLEGQKTLPCRIVRQAPKELEMTMHEGRKRQIRKVFALFHYHVEKLQRIRQGGLELGSLKEGEWRFLTPAEVARISQGFRRPPKGKKAR